MYTRPKIFLPLLLSLCVGALSVFAFAPFGFWPLQIVTLAIVFHLALRANSVRHSAMIGWAFGFGWSACGVYWLFISMHRYGGLPSWMAGVAVCLMALTLGAFAMLALASGSWLQKRLRAPEAVSLLFIFPAFWALSEWLRGWILTGLPWVASGYAHTSGPLAGFAPIVGVFGIGWCVAFIAGCIVSSLTRRSDFRISALVVAVSVLAIGFGLKYIQWTEPNGQPISVRLLQGNVPQEMKFSKAQIESTLVLYHDMIAAQPADLIATPETAIPILAQQLPPDYLPRLAGIAEKSKSHLLIGIPIYDGPKVYTNSVIGLAPSAMAKPAITQYRYDKHHLVPFGEFIPTGFRWFVEMMQIPLGDFTRGKIVQEPFAVKDQWILPNICYEDLFGEEIAEQIAASQLSGTAQPTILLNMSNIAWFGDTIALPQHLQISQMRSLETGRPMLRSTNTGTTAVISHKGEISAQLPPYTRGGLSASVQGYRGATLYTLHGNKTFVAFALAMLFVGWILARKLRRRNYWG